MKKRDFILTAALLCVAGFLWLGGLLIRGRAAGTHLVITVDNEVYGTYDLQKDREIWINSTNRCRITDGRASMIWADCPDWVCVHSNSIDASGETIICMPNKVVLEVADDE